MPCKELSSPRKITLPKQQLGFTLLEIMVALVIFAMLAVAGWQVFDSLNKSKERANIHADALSDIQYAYLQLQNDLNQVTAWQTKQLSQAPTPDNNASNHINPTSINTDTNKENEPVDYNTPAFFVLDSQDGISFIRFADPDPRYQTSPTLTRVSYKLVDDKLIRQQFFNLSEDSKSIDSVMLKDVTQVNWQALLPEETASFSSIENQNKQINADNGSHQNSSSQKDTKEPFPMLPKGVSLSFMYQENTIEWLFALPNEAPALASNYDINKDTDKTPPSNSDNQNSNNNNNSTNGNEQGSTKNANEDSQNQENSKKQSKNDEFEDEYDYFN